jgi:cysteine synthase
MRLVEVKPSIIEAIEPPNLVELGPGLVAAAFSLMKLIPARFMLDRARSRGDLAPGSLVVETTSGTFGLALAILCNLEGYRLHLVSDPAVDPALHRRLTDLGATVDIVTQPAPVGGLQRARLDRLDEVRAESPCHFWPRQYTNPDNPASYAGLAELLAGSVGRIDCLVGTVGSGGSMCGTSTFLRRRFPQLVAIGVDTHGSVLFGLPDEGARMLRGLGNSLMPANLDHRAFDEVHWVTAAEAFLATRQLHRRHALFAGPTSGAAYMVARWWAERNPGSRVVMLLPDEGYRYQETVYDDGWLHANGVALEALPDEPLLVEDREGLPRRWTRFRWARRSYLEVVGTPWQER